MRTIINLLFLFISFHSFSQDEVQMRITREAAESVTLYSVNYLNTPVYIVLDMNYRFRDQANLESPIIKRAEPGTHNFLNVSGPRNVSISGFDYEFRYFPSNPNPSVDPDFPYLIPAKPGELVEVLNIRSTGNDRKIGFLLSESNNVTASRKGIVIDFYDQSQSSIDKKRGKLNYIDILHDDGTIGSYFNLIPRSVRFSIGDKVFAGQKIAEAYDYNSNQYLVGFQLYHHLITEEKQSLVPEFLHDNLIVSQVVSGKRYKSVHDENILFMELDKKELRLIRCSLNEF